MIIKGTEPMKVMRLTQIIVQDKRCLTGGDVFIARDAGDQLQRALPVSP